MLELIKRKDKRERNTTIHKAHVDFGYTSKEIVEHLNLHYTTVSKIVKRVEADI